MAKYKYAPILEALCEFRFKQGTPWDLTIPGLFYEAINEDFPIKEEVPTTQLQFQAGPQGISNPVLQNYPPLMRFKSEDGRSLMQVGFNVLSVHVLAPYPQWTGFRPMIERGLQAYNKITSLQGFERVGLRYINRIEIPLSDSNQIIRIEDYLQALPSVPEPIPQTFINWYMNVSVDHEESNGFMTIQTHPASGVELKEIVIMLDLYYQSKEISLISYENVMQWLDMAHEHIDKDFEACITGKSRSLFSEEKH